MPPYWNAAHNTTGVTAGLVRPSTSHFATKAWMPATSAGMTAEIDARVMQNTLACTKTRAADRLRAGDRILFEHLAEWPARQIARLGAEPLDDGLVLRRGDRGGAALLQDVDRSIGRLGRDDQPTGAEADRRKPKLLHGRHVGQSGDPLARDRGENGKAAGLRHRGTLGDRHDGAAEQRMRHRSGALE